MAKTKNIGVILTTLGAALVIPIILGCISNAHAESTEFSITVEPSVSLTLSDASVNMQITPTRAGTFDSSSFTAYASTNNTTGYTLSLAATNSSLTSNTLNASSNDFPTIPSIAETQDGISAEAFAATTDANILNHWGLAIDSGNFKDVKTTATAIKTTNTTATNDPTTISMASKLDLLTVPGVYSTTLNFQITANPLPDDLGSALDKTNKPKRTIDGEDYYQIQDITAVVCDDVDIVPSTLKVYDSRDNHIYTVGKLLDNRCWLLDNLALDLTNPTVQANLSPENTNASQTAINALLNGGRVEGNDSTNRYATSGVTSFSGFSNNSYSVPQIDATRINETSSNYPSGGDSFPDASSWKFGVYYNFCAASAGSYCYGNGKDDPGTGYDAPGTAVDVDQDICPANWRLPTGDQPDGDGGELYKLEIPYRDENYSYYAGMRAALRLPLGGYHDGGGVYIQGSEGHWFSSTMLPSYPGSNAGLYSSKTSIDALNTKTRYLGYNVRCIAK